MQGTLVDPNEEQRRLVRAMSGFGIPQEQIATHLEVDAKTLRKHFRAELDRGMVEANLKVAQSLFAMATQGKNVAAAIFWMKARAGWREKHEVQITARPLSELSDAELNDVLRDGLAEFAQKRLGIEGDCAEDAAADRQPLEHPREPG